MNCVLNPDSSVRLSLSYTRSIDSNKTFESIDDAEVMLFENHELWGILSNTTAGCYELNKKPSIGKNYQLKINIAGELPISAETTIPNRLRVDTTELVPIFYHTEDNHFLKSCSAKYTITDDQEIKCWNYEIYKETHYVNDSDPDIPGHDQDYYFFEYGLSYLSPFADNFNRQIDNIYDLGYYYHFYVRQTNEIQPGSAITFTKTSIRKNTIDYYFNADVHYDKYMKSRIQSWIITEWQDLPFNEPVQMYSNITNAMGIFGSATFSFINYINISINE
ncbi:MAG: DUF4249 family protein [Mangrovibacterium sp.]